MKKTVWLLLWSMLLAACQPAENPNQDLPTLAVLPSEAATEAPELTSTTAPDNVVEASPTQDALPAFVLTETPAFTAPTMTRTPRPVTATHTVEPTIAAIGTATQAVVEAPRFSTFTPAPNGSAVQGAVQQFADVMITEPQFQEEVDVKRLAYPDIERAIINFVADGIDVQLTAFDGTTSISGNVLVSILLTGDYATITISSITTGDTPPPQGYIDLATGDFFRLMVESLDSILKQRLGPEQNLQTIVVTDSVMLISLLVPQPN